MTAMEDRSRVVCRDPEVMGGVACFTGTRVPVSIVLASLDEGCSFEEVRRAYPFLTRGHVQAARQMVAACPEIMDEKPSWSLYRRPTRDR